MYPCWCLLKSERINCLWYALNSKQCSIEINLNVPLLWCELTWTSHHQVSHKCQHVFTPYILEIICCNTGPNGAFMHTFVSTGRWGEHGGNLVFVHHPSVCPLLDSRMYSYPYYLLSTPGAPSSVGVGQHPRGSSQLPQLHQHDVCGRSHDGHSCWTLWSASQNSFQHHQETHKWEYISINWTSYMFYWSKTSSFYIN